MSIIRSTVIAALLSAGFVGAAYARDGVVTVRLAAPIEATTQVIALNTLWSCNGDTCLARPTHGINVRSCRQFIRQAGNVQVVSYGNEEQQLSADEIARCNGQSSQSLQASNQ
jgi:hypothetical protein